MLNKFYNKVIPILILIQPIFDVVTSIMSYFEFDITLGIVIKMLLMLICIIYLVFIDKKNLKFNFVVLLLIFILFIFNVLGNINVLKAQPLQYLSYTVKYIYLMVMLLYFYRWFNNGNRIKLSDLRIPLFIISLVFIISLISGTSFHSYDTLRRGYSGWFNSANELGALLCLLFPISIYNAFHNPEGEKIDFLLFLCCGFMLIMIGTKTGLFGFFITLVCYIVYRLVSNKKYKLDYKFLSVLVVLFIPIIFWNELPSVYNTKLRIKTNNIEQMTSQNINKILLSGRDEYAVQMESNRKNIKFLSILVGKTYLKSDNSILIVEQDFLDIYYLYGGLGLFMFLLSLLYLLGTIIVYYKRRSKKESFNVELFVCIVSVLLSLAIAYISGHVLLSPAVSIYSAMIIVILGDLCKIRRDESKKNMIIYMPKLSVGGMEQALINLLNMSSFKDKCNIDLYLGYSVEKKYLDSIPKEVNIILLCKGKWNVLGKIVASFKMVLTYFNLLINRDAYDISICYAYQHGILSKLSRLSSNNTIIFIHNDLLKCRTPEELKKLKFKVKYDKFSKVVCVSDGAKKSFKTIYPNYKGQVMTINNYIDGEKILRLSKEKIKDFKKSKITTFINVGRHEEKAKKVSRIIESSNKLFKEGYDFRVVLIGDGEDHKLYKSLIASYKLEKKILLLGKKVNPYPYFKYSDCFILSSEYEGYGLVLDESRILNIPIISTDVADSKKIMEEGYGILCKNSNEGIYKGMKKYLDEGYKIKSRFDYNKFNKEITEKLNKFVLGE